MLWQSRMEPPKGITGIINNAYRIDEQSIVSTLLEAATLSAFQKNQTQKLAYDLVDSVRKSKKKSTGIDSFLSEYALSSDEGIALMCLAEALLRVPDDKTIDKLIKDKLTGVDWKSHKGQSDSFFVNATTWALMLTGKVLSPESARSTASKALLNLLNKSGEGVVRHAVDKAMRILSKQFVMGRNINLAIQRAQKKEARGYRYSYDMLGEAAITQADADRYLAAYEEAIQAIGLEAKKYKTVYERPGISIKLSALHPRYSIAQKERVLIELPPKLLQLATLAQSFDIPLTIDAEESERLSLSLAVIEKVFLNPALKDWQGFGLAVQSYQKRAFYVLDWVANLARTANRRIMVRLIKGAYWDSEIKKTQVQGLSDYPVFTRKVFTDVSFQACAKKLLTLTDVIYPMFATHNAYSVAMILNLVGDYRDFEFQCLHGMGTELYEEIVPQDKKAIPCRIYAPVGSHEDLLPYLVRRLLENGANSSFVNRIVDEKMPIETLVEDPIDKAASLLKKSPSNIPNPADIFKPIRENSKGFDWSDEAWLCAFQNECDALSHTKWEAKPIPCVNEKQQTPKNLYSPHDKTQLVGTVIEANFEDVEAALSLAHERFKSWSKTNVEDRAAILVQFATLLERDAVKLMVLANDEAGKTWADAQAELREAIDFCYYYAQSACSLMNPTLLQGYTGETNELSLHPRGTLLCISPWNFPLAIFVGQVVAALVTGNCVIAKPAEQTPLMAYEAVKLMLEAGVPEGVISLLPGDGAQLGSKLVSDRRIKGVIFTGSTQTATIINQTLAQRVGEIIPFIAETGGQNAMIVDSSALLEQVVNDAIQSAFGSAGQRCSALRVIFVQDDVFPRFKALLVGAMKELIVGSPEWLSTDVGPVIDKDAQTRILAHVKKMKKTHEVIYQCELSKDAAEGYFVAPTALLLANIDSLAEEIFGPVLHVIPYKASALDDVIEQINSTGYGLTLGIHSRIASTVEYIKKNVHAGNCYVNRNMIGAVVGLQPFGGEGLSGTGPKAGGPHYLLRLCHERTFTVDTTAAGGNASLMAMPE